MTQGVYRFVALKHTPHIAAERLPFAVMIVGKRRKYHEFVGPNPLFALLTKGSRSAAISEVPVFYIKPMNVNFLTDI